MNNDNIIKGDIRMAHHEVELQGEVVDSEELEMCIAAMGIMPSAEEEECLRELRADKKREELMRLQDGDQEQLEKMDFLRKAEVIIPLLSLDQRESLIDFAQGTINREVK